MANKTSVKLRTDRFNSNINNRGKAKAERKTEDGGIKVGALALGFFVFLVAGSAIFQILGILTKTELPE